MSESATPRLLLRGIEKRFGGVQALRGADLSAMPGEVLGLCGENGAGKSTLLKVLGGVYPHGSFRGEVLVDGVPRRLRGTADARAAGIAVVHQELMLVPEMSVAENLLLGAEAGTTLGILHEAALEARARALLARYPFAAGLDPLAPVGRLGTGLRQIVEIVRALGQDARILVLDEPTAALSEEESARLRDILRAIARGGTTCIYVSHRLDEVFALCSRITVLRDGRTTGTVVTAETTPAEVVALMIGRPPVVRGPAPPAGALDTVLEARGLSLRTKRGAVLEGISLALRAGEVVALCGAMGSGRTALLSTLFGCARGTVDGEVRLGGQGVRLDSPRAALRHGIALVPEDRKGQGLVLGMDLCDNLALPGRDGGILLDEARELHEASELLQALHVHSPAGAAAPAGTLSGGNQQKVVLGKWLRPPPRVLLLDEPTRGVDVGAREEIYALVESLCQEGAAVLMASSDLQEVQRLAHRILVLRAGRLCGALPGGADIAEIVRLSTGAGIQEAA